MLDPKHLYWLAEIVDLGSFSQAAAKLNVTQPTLSRAVQVIEDQVGSPVVERERHGVRPTRIGQRLAETGRSIAGSRIQAENAVDLWRGGQDRELRVGVGPMLAASIMGAFFSELLEAKTKYAVRVVSATASRLIERLNEGELDIVLAPEQINLLQDDLYQHKLFEDRLAVFAGPKNQFYKRAEPIEAEELADERWIAIGALSGIFGSQKEVFSSMGMKRASASINFTGDVLMAAEMLLKTDVLCIMPARLGNWSGVLRGTKVLPLTVTLPSRDVVLWCRRTERHRPDVLDFLKRLESRNWVR
ncbi:MAG: LysR family transcriptional regulator [Pseudomonadota bacterium]